MLFCSAEYRKDLKTGRIQRPASDAQNKSKMVYREEAERTEKQKVYSRLERKRNSQHGKKKKKENKRKLTVQSDADQRQFQLHG